MAGQFMDKETLEAEANRLNVNLTGLTWPQKQKAVLDARRESLNMNLSGADSDGDDRPSNPSTRKIDSKIIEKVLESNDEEVYIKAKVDPMDIMRGKKLMIAPEMASTVNQVFGYEEELDEDIVVEELVHDVDTAYKAGKDMVTGTYSVLEHTGKKVVAHTALPKQGAGITFVPDEDIVPVVTFQGRSGYLWTHHRLPNIKQLLIDSGYYFEYKDRFKDEPFIWHAAGKLLVCDRMLVESIFREIEEKERQRRLNEAQTSEFIKNNMR